jgi:transcriptional regulator with XRE-family HTH domain
MASPQLPNYLRTNRKRFGLSQDEVAYLLGAESGAKVCRYERFVREPGLRAALACEAIFQRPVRELFAGLYAEIEREVAGRAKKLVLKTDRMKPGQRTDRKRERLAKIATAKSKKIGNP